jgi:hypothetical protein
VLTGAGLAWALAQRRRWLAATALVLLAAAGPLAFARIDGRYGAPYDHPAIRSAAAVIPREALVIAYDSVPAALLYRLGRNGWWLEGQDQLATVPGLQARGARFIAARGDRRAHLAAYGPPLFEVDGLAVFRLP